MSGNDSKNKTRSVRISTSVLYAMGIGYEYNLSFLESVGGQRLGPPPGATLNHVGRVTSSIHEHPTRRSINMDKFTTFKNVKITQL